MKLTFSDHWKHKRQYRKSITEKHLEFAISKGQIERDRRWADAFNALIKVPNSGRTLKVVFRRMGPETYKIITAYWLD